MKNQIRFYDTTLRDGEQTIGVNFSIDEKVALAKSLENFGVDAIEAGFPAASAEDFEAVEAVSEAVQEAEVVGLARMVKKDIDAAIAATNKAKHQVIHVFIATSPIHRETKLKMTKAEIIEKIQEDVAYTKSRVDKVIFSPEDATRTEPDYLVASIDAAIAAGATTINIPDTVGYDLPEEYGELFDYLHDHIQAFDQVTWSTHTHNDLGLANANALAGVAHGATEIQGTINGIGERAGNVDLIEAAVTLQVRRDHCQQTIALNLQQATKIAHQVENYSKVKIAANKAIVGRNAFAHESGIHQDGYLKNPATYEILSPAMVGASASMPLGKLSGSHAVSAKLKELGYEMPIENIAHLFPAFKTLAEKVSIVSDDQLIALAEQELAEGVVAKWWIVKRLLSSKAMVLGQKLWRPAWMSWPLWHRELILLMKQNFCPLVVRQLIRSANHCRITRLTKPSAPMPFCWVPLVGQGGTPVQKGRKMACWHCGLN